MSGKVADQIQIWGFEGHNIIFNDSSLGFGIEIEPLQITSWDDDRINSYSQSLKSFLNGLPSHLDVQFTQEITSGNTEKIDLYESLSKSAKEPAAVALAGETINFLRGYDQNGDLPVQRGFLFVRKPPESSLLPKRSLFDLKKDFQSMTEEALKREILILERIQNNLLRNLEDLELKPKLIDSYSIVNLAYKNWNPNRPVGLDGFDPDDVRGSLTFSDVVMDVSGFAIGDQHFRVLSLKMLPDQTYSGMIAELQRLPFRSKLCVSIHVPDQITELESLKTQRRVAYSMVVGKKTGVSDIESQAKFQDLENILEEMVSRGEKVFRFSVQVILQNPSLEVLEDQVSETLMMFRGMGGSEAMVESLPSFEIFSDLSIPHVRSRERLFKIKTSNLCDFLPVFGPWRGHTRPSVLLRNRQGGLTSIDVFDPSLVASNQLIVGGSGSGKSFLTNLLLLPMTKDNAKITFVDIGGSYKKLCENLNGQYLNLGLDDGMSINPFDLMAGETEPGPQKIKFLLGLVEILVRENQTSALSKFIKSEIEKSILEVYRTSPNPKLTDLKNKIETHENEEIRRISKTLSLWCGSSPYGKFLDQDTNISLSKDITCFDLKNLENYKDLQEVCLYIIIDIVWREIQKDKGRPKFIVFDECWKLLKDNGTAGATDFIEEIARTVRKYYGSLICLTQSLDDFLKSKIAQALLNNSPIKWILIQNQDDFKVMSETLGLNQNEIAQIRSLTQKKGFFSEVYLISGRDRAVVVIQPTPLQLWMATTDPRDMSKIAEREKLHQNLSNLEILTQLSKDFPHGVANAKS